MINRYLGLFNFIKFKINRDHFSSGLHLYQCCWSKKNNAYPPNVLIEAKADMIHLTTTNLDLGVRCSVKANVTDEGSITLPVRIYQKLLESWQIWKFVWNQRDPKSTISTRGSVFNLIGLDSKEFPASRVRKA